MFTRTASITRQPWFAYFELGCVLLAGGLWYLAPAGMVWTLPLSLALAPWVVRLLLAGRLTRRTPFDLPLLLFVASAGVGVWAAFDRVYAWQKFWWVVGAVFLFYALSNGRAFWPRRGPAAADLRLWGLTGFGLLLSFYFMATHEWAAYPTPAAIERLGLALQALLPDLPGHRLNPNVAGGMLAFVAPFTAALLLTAGRLERSPRLTGLLATTAGLALALILLGLLLTYSRGAWLALAGAAGLYLLWLTTSWIGIRYSVFGNPFSVSRSPFLLFGSSLALLLALPLLGLWLWPAGGWALLERLLPAGVADLNRVALLRGGLVLAADYPFTGGGLGSFMMLYSTYSLLLHVGHSFHAHNLFLDVAIEQGLPALLLLGWLWLLLGKGLLVWLRPSSPNIPRPNSPRLVYPPALGAAALALVTILLHGLVDDAFYGSRALLLFFVPLAFAVPRAPRGRRTMDDGRWTMAPNLIRGGPQMVGLRRVLSSPIVYSALLLGGLLLAAFLWRQPLLGAWYANRGAVAQSRAELSVYAWPEWDIQDRVRQEVDLDTAVTHFEQALTHNPQQATARRRLGLISLSRQEYEQALAHLEAAYGQLPADNATRQWLGEAYIVNGRVDEGISLWETVNNNNGQLAIRAYWYGQLDDPQRLAWVQSAIERVSVNGER
jgi:hypothetical protein